MAKTDQGYHMDRFTLFALVGSLRKWHKLVLGETKTEGGSNDCPLCHMYNKAFLGTGSDCAGCPVREHSKEDFCKGTPYGKAIAQIVLRESGLPYQPDLIQAELDFLFSLLPQDQSNG
jgi:hypothetical protein